MNPILIDLIIFNQVTIGVFTVLAILKVNNRVVEVQDEMAEVETRTKNRINGFLTVFQKARDIK